MFKKKKKKELSRYLKTTTFQHWSDFSRRWNRTFIIVKDAENFYYFFRFHFFPWKYFLLDKAFNINNTGP